ncbi:MAG TPA: transposase [Actinomycetota bacterium]
MAELLRRIREAPAPTLRGEEDEARAACVLALVDAIETCQSRVRELEAEVVERLEVHADAAIFTSRPRAGRGVHAASLLAEIGDARERFPNAESLIALAGTAPVTHASGKHRSVNFRWACARSCARQSWTSPMTRAMPRFGPPTSTDAPWPEAAPSPTPFGSWPARGSA